MPTGPGCRSKSGPRKRVPSGSRGGRVIAVMSGKGGVGKSYVTATSRGRWPGRGRRSAVDADLNGPPSSCCRCPTPHAPALRRVASDGCGWCECIPAMLLEDGAPLASKGRAPRARVARGDGGLRPRELLGDVAWGALDALLLDLPPDAALRRAVRYLGAPLPC